MPAAQAYKPRKDRLVAKRGGQITKPQRIPGSGSAMVPKPARPKPGLGTPSKPTPGGAAGTAPAPVGQKAEFDPAYYNRIDLAGRKEEQRLGELGNQEGDIKREFGIEDPTDPFSRANAMKQSFLSRQKAQSVNLASQGQLYSGTHERAIARTRREEEQARSELRRAYEGAIGAVGSQKANVKFATEEERAQAFEDWLARAPEAEAAPITDAEAEASPDASASSASGAPVRVLRPDAPTLTAPGDQAAQATLRTNGAEARARQVAKAKRDQLLQKRKAEINTKRQAAKDVEAPSSVSPTSSSRSGGRRPAARPKPRPRVTARRGGRIR